MSNKATEPHTDKEAVSPEHNEGEEIAVTARKLHEALEVAEASLEEPGRKSEPELPNEPGAKGVEPPPVEVEEEIEVTEPEPQPAEAKDINEDGIPDDPVIDEAIDEIVAQEADVVLEAEDQSRDLDNGETIAEKIKPQSKLGRFFGSSKVRWTIFILAAASVFGVSTVPQSRYYVLNSFGVRSSVSLSVIDELTRQPLKNVSVRIADKSGLTDQDGKVTIEEVELGPTTLQIEKRAFAIIERNVTIGWGSNPLGEFEAKAVGAQYEFSIKDYLSGKPIKGAEATSGDGNAKSDETGKVVLSLDTAKLEDDAQVSISFSAANYRDEVVKINVNNKESQSVELVPSRKHVYVSKRSGTYDVYAAYIDGTDEQKLVKGTGLERDDIALIPHQKDDVAALVTTRENVRNSEGLLLSTLYVLSTKDGTLVKIDQSEKVQIIGWDTHGHLVYVKIAAGASATDPKRHRLMSFNNKDFTDVKELASANAFNDIIMANGRVFYAQSGAFADKTAGAVFGTNPDGSDKKTLLSKEAASIIRSDYETLYFRTDSGWYSYIIGTSTEAAAGSTPANQTNRIYADNPARPLSVWRDSREGKGVLVGYDKNAKKEASLISAGGLSMPVYWLGEKYLVYRMNNETETADYILNIEGGEPRKITDVTDYAGIGRWVVY